MWRTFRAGRALLARPGLAALSPRAAASKAVASAKPRGSDPRVKKEVAEYWDQVLQSVDKPTALKLLPHIDVHQVLGLRLPSDADLAAASSASDGDGPSSSAAARRRPFSSRKGKPPLYDYCASVKKAHPKAVLLVRVGEFYEATGIDAVLLVQHAGLNAMGSGNPPRAGCPRVNLRRTVEDLVAAGLSVVVCEEATEHYSWGSMRTKQKQRYVASVVTPATPHLLYGLVDEDADLPIDAAPPLLALVPQVGGYTVLEVSADLGTMTVMEGLTEDAVYARLHEGGLVPPLFLHLPQAGAAADRRLTEGTFEREWEQRVAAIFRSQVGLVERYSDPDPMEGLLTRVRTMLNLGADFPFNVIRASSHDRPRPLYYSTALNLGLHKARGQPCLLDYLVPPASPLPARRWLRRLLLLPPPPATAVAVHRACGTLAVLAEALPIFPMLPPHSVVLKLGTPGAANAVFFRELGLLCQAIQDLLTRDSHKVQELAGSLLEVACRERGVELSQAQLLEGCEAAGQAIHEVVDHDALCVEGGDEWLPALEGCAEDVREGMWKLMRANERPFRGKVRDSVMPAENEAVVRAGMRVQRELEAAVQPLLDASKLKEEPASKRPSVIFDVNNNALWLRFPKGSAASEAAGHLKHPHDRNGKTEGSSYTSAGLESALDDYRRACYEAAAAVRHHLRELARQLQATQKELVCAATMSVAAAALEAHTREALRRGWRLPAQGFTSDGPPPLPESGEADPLEMANFWPYWLDGWDPATVHNSLSLEGMAMLTGPNMAGKSTILRSVCAVALLGACGLYAPAAEARVPYFDAFMLRNFSSDSPLEGRSAFAVEMTEMRYVLEDVTPRSLVLVDELGKGTEVRAGSSLAGALVEELDGSRCRGVFATHLHALLDLELMLSNTEFYMMETAPAEEQEAAAALGELDGIAITTAAAAAAASSNGNGAHSISGGSGGQGAAVGSTAAAPLARRPTWRIVQGISTESMALDVARRCRLPSRVVERAAELYQQLEPPAKPEEADQGAAAAAVAGQAVAGQAAVEPASPSPSGVPRGRAARATAARSSSPSSSTSSSPWTLEAASKALQQVAQEALANCGPAEVPPAQLQEVRFVQRGQRPGPATVGTSCVYVLRRSDGHFYAGSTDALHDRLRAHRQRTGKGGPDVEMAYLCLGPSRDAASLALAVESAAIRELQRRGFPMLSTTDARRRHLTGAGGAATASSSGGT